MLDNSQQLLLFDKDAVQASLDSISDLTYVRDFISSECEKELLRYIDQRDWICDLKRRVQHYGYRYNYSKGVASAYQQIGELPGLFQGYSELLFRSGFFAKKPNQVIVNEYLPGQGISPHVDSLAFGGVVASLSLGSACEMDFLSDSGKKHSFWLERRSLLVLSGEARYKWKHGIAKRKSDMFYGNRVVRKRRVSLTFRNVFA